MHVLACVCITTSSGSCSDLPQSVLVTLSLSLHQLPAVYIVNVECHKTNFGSPTLKHGHWLCDMYVLAAVLTALQLHAV